MQDINNNENLLDQETIESIKKDLIFRKQQIETELSQIANSGHGEADGPAKFPDFGTKLDENAQEVGEYTTNIATEKILNSTLRDVNGALKRMDEGVYGVCKYCHKPIGKKRMLARPVASACVECKTKLQNAI